MTVSARVTDAFWGRLIFRARLSIVVRAILAGADRLSLSVGPTHFAIKCSALMGLTDSIWLGTDFQFHPKRLAWTPPLAIGRND